MILIPRRKIFFVVFTTDLSEKGPEFLAKIFFLFLVFAIDLSEKGPEFLAKTFLFWSAEMVAPAETLLGLNVAHKFKRLPTPSVK